MHMSKQRLEARQAGGQRPHVGRRCARQRKHLHASDSSTSNMSCSTRLRRLPRYDRWGSDARSSSEQSISRCCRWRSAPLPGGPTTLAAQAAPSELPLHCCCCCCCWRQRCWSLAPLPVLAWLLPSGCCAPRADAAAATSFRPGGGEQGAQRRAHMRWRAGRGAVAGSRPHVCTACCNSCAQPPAATRRSKARAASKHCLSLPAHALHHLPGSGRAAHLSHAAPRLAAPTVSAAGSNDQAGPTTRHRQHPGPAAWLRARITVAARAGRAARAR